MLHFFDVLFTVLHLAIVFFNLFGWVWISARRAHLVCVILTAASWFILGIWFGIGYCPITDWQWQIKERLGEQDLPSSFVKYFADKVTGANIPSSIIDTATMVCFLTAATLAVYFNFFKRPKKADFYEIH